MKPVKAITSPAAMELLGDETRRRIIYLLRARESTISQVAEELDMTPQAIYHHVKKLRAAGMVEVSREERIENFIETYYRATAEVFEFSWGSSPSKNQAKMAEQRLRDTLQSLDKIGIKVSVTTDIVTRMLRVSREMEAVGEKKDLQEKVSKLEDVDLIGKQQLTSVARMISMTDKQFEEWMMLQKEFRKLLKDLQSTKRLRTV